MNIPTLFFSQQISDCQKQFLKGQINNNSNNSKCVENFKNIVPRHKDNGTGPLTIPSSDLNTYLGNIGYNFTKHIEVPESTCNNIPVPIFFFLLLSVCDTMNLMETVTNSHIFDLLDIAGYLLHIFIPVIDPSLSYI